MSDLQRFDVPFDIDVTSLRERLAAAAREHRDKLRIDWTTLTGHFSYWKLGLFGAEGSFEVRPRESGEGGYICVQVTRHRGIPLANVRETVETLLVSD